MRITINIVRRDAAALAGVTRELNQIKAAAGGAGGAMGNWGAAFDSVTKFGKNLQWTGRQLEYRFTLPLVAAGAAAFKFANDNERALTQVRKVYGEVGGDQAVLTAEVNKLGEAFTLLSGIFGVHKDEVISIAADWAAAGAAGAGLALRTRATLEAMILGDMQAAEATQALITMTQSYGLSSEELTKALATFNIVENETAVTMSDLIQITQLTGGAAREAGVDLRHLAAMAAAMIPAAGTASEAGNALKTTIANIMAPTTQATAAFEALGISVTGAAWANSNFDERLNLLADSYGNLSQNQKLVFDRNVVNIRQISRLSILLNDINNAQGRYNKALEVSASDAQNAAQYNKELGIVLSSQPRAFQAMIVQIQNSLAQIILPMMPVILSVLNEVRKMIQAFTDLSPKTQKLIMSMLALLAVLGPIAAYMGSFAILFGTLGKWVFDAAKAIVFIATNPIALLIAAIIAAGVVMYIFRDQIRDALASAANAFKQFLQIIGNVMVAIWKVVVTVAMKIYEALQYLNPFARHSPSLVDDVRAGVATILDEYSKLSGISDILRATMAEVENFKRATDDIQIKGSAASRAQDRVDLASLGASPEALAAFDALTSRLNQLQAQLPAIQTEIDAQAVAVSKWASELKKADTALAGAQARLDDLTDAASVARDELDQAKTVLDNLFSYNISGEQAASDAIFNNEQAVKSLRLELLRLQESGQSIDDVTGKLADLSGQIEKMQSMEKDLRLAGAGSEITGPIRAQIDMLEAQRKALTAPSGTADRQTQLADQIKLLERQGEILSLESSLKFDPLKRQLDLLKNGLKEMPFDQLVAAITAQQAVVGKLTDRYDDATAAVTAQKAVVDQLTKARNALNDTYQRETDKLNALKDAYDAVNQAMQDINSASNAITQGNAGAGANPLGTPGDFPLPGGTGAIGREGGLKEIQDLIDQWTKEMQGQFDAFDPLKSLKEKFQAFQAWLKPWQARWSGFWDEISAIANNKAVQIGALVALALIDPFVAIGVAVFLLRDQFAAAWDWIVQKTQGFRDGFIQGLQPIWDELAKWGPTWDAFVKVLEEAWTILLPILGVFVTMFVGIFENLKVAVIAIWNTLWEVLKVTWTFFGEFIAAGLEILRGIFNVVLGLLTGDWSLAWDGLKGIFEGFWHSITAIWDLGKGIFVDVIPTALRGFKDVFVSIFEEMWNLVSKIFGTIEDGAIGMVNGVIGGLNSLIHAINKFQIHEGGVHQSLGPLGEITIIPAFDWGGFGIPDIGYIGGSHKSVAGLPDLGGLQGLAAGGIVFPRPGGTVFRLGERGYAEKVVPLDASRGSGDGHTINIYGNLEFPNVTGAGDADGFVRNLRVLATNA